MSNLLHILFFPVDWIAGLFPWWWIGLLFGLAAITFIVWNIQHQLGCFARANASVSRIILESIFDPEIHHRYQEYVESVITRPSYRTNYKRNHFTQILADPNSCDEKRRDAIEMLASIMLKESRRIKRTKEILNTKGFDIRILTEETVICDSLKKRVEDIINNANGIRRDERLWVLANCSMCASWILAFYLLLNYIYVLIQIIL